MYRVITLAMLGLASTYGRDANILKQYYKDGGCPPLKAFDLDLTKLFGKSFKLLATSDKDATRQGACASLRVAEYLDGKNSSVCVFQPAHRYDLHEVAPWKYKEPLQEFVTVYDDSTAFVQREADTTKGITN